MGTLLFRLPDHYMAPISRATESVVRYTVLSLQILCFLIELRRTKVLVQVKIIALSVMYILRSSEA